MYQRKRNPGRIRPRSLACVKHLFFRSMKDRSGPPSVKRYFLGCWSLASGTHFSVKFIPFRLRAKLRDVAVILKLFLLDQGNTDTCNLLGRAPLISSSSAKTHQDIICHPPPSIGLVQYTLLVHPHLSGFVQVYAKLVLRGWDTVNFSSNNFTKLMIHVNHVQFVKS